MAPLPSERARRDEKPTGAKPVTIRDITFRCYRYGILKYHWVADGFDPELVVYRNFNRETYIAWYGRECAGRRFRSIQSAMKAAIKLMDGYRASDNSNPEHLPTDPR